MTKENSAPIVIYENADEAVEVRLEGDQETVWLTQGVLFCVKSQNITMHLKSIYGEGELVEGATCKDFLQVQSGGGRELKLCCATARPPRSPIKVLSNIRATKTVCQ